MQINKIKYENYSVTYELKINNNKLIVLADYGPRIIYFGNDKTGNVLFHDNKRELVINGWYIIGGHRFWISPETDQTYNHDNEPCEIKIEDGCFKVTAFDTITKLEKSIKIYEKNNRFIIEHSLTNKGLFLYHAGIWGITAVLPEGVVFMPSTTKGVWSLNKVIYWKKWPHQTTNIFSKQYIQTDDLFLIKPTGEAGKVGVSGDEGFIGVTNKNYTFIIKIEKSLYGSYPDDNCALECYTCNKFIELETLGPVTTLMTEIPVKHTEEWILFDEAVNPEDGIKIRNIL